jgi:hypothetical protein
MPIKYTNIYHCKTLPNLPKLGFLVLKYTIWQPRWMSLSYLGNNFCTLAIPVGVLFSSRQQLSLGATMATTFIPKLQV